MATSSAATATTCVQSPQDIIAAKGAKQVYRATSGERGELVTTCGIISADGNHLPPVMGFPRKFFKDHMIHGAPPNTLGLSNPSGWMTAELFKTVVGHFIKFTHSTKDNPSLLIFDNHDSHFSIEALKNAKEHGVTILTLPPHSSNKMQPLDIAVYGPFKRYYTSACDKWMSDHPGKTLDIYKIAHCVGEAYPKAMTPSNIVSGFRKAGIYPFNPQVFTESDFATASVTDRELEVVNAPQDDPQDDPRDAPQAAPQDAEIPDVAQNVIFEVDTSVLDEIPIPPQENLTFKTPESIRPYPKAPSRKVGTRGRKRAKSIIVTDENVMQELEEKEKVREEKAANKGPKKKKTVKETAAEDTVSKVGKKRKPAKEAEGAAQKKRRIQKKQK